MLPFLRRAAAAVLFLEAAAVFAIGTFALHRIRVERLQEVGRAELWLCFAAAAVFQAAGGWQILRGSARGWAWLPALASALATPGWLRLAGAVPLCYLIAELVMQSRRNRGESGADAAAADSRQWLLDTGVFVAAVALANLAWYAMPGWLHPAVPEDARVNLGAWAVAVWASIVLHEVGHAAGAAAAGFRLTKFAVFPVEYTRTSRHSFWRLNGKMFLGGFYMGVPALVTNLERRYLWMTACGPLAGFGYAAACWYTLWTAQGGLGGFAYGVLRESMSFSLVMSLLNLMPVRSGAMRMDGRILWDAVFDRKSTETTVALLGCSSSLRSSLRPREWPEQWVHQLRTGRLDAMSAPLLAYSAEDRLNTTPSDLVALNDLALSSAAIGQVAEQLAAHAQARAAFQLHRAWLRSRYGGERVHWDTIDSVAADPETEPHEILRLQAALLASEGDAAAALVKLDQAEGALGGAPESGLDAADLDGLRAFREELLAVTGPSAAGGKSHTR